MSDLPDNLRYTKDHEWARRNPDGTITVGITAHAVEQLGDITAVSLPDVGEAIARGERFGDIDSVKAVSDLYAPLSGEIVEINTKLDDEPELINDEPYAGGWMIRVQPEADADESDLLDPAAYRKLLDED